MHQAHPIVGWLSRQSHDRRGRTRLRFILMCLQVLLLHGVALGQQQTTDEKLRTTASAVEKLGQKFSCLRELQTSRNTPEYWKGVTKAEFEKRLEDALKSLNLVPPEEWSKQNGGYGRVDPFVAVRKYCENPPQVNFPTTFQFEASVQEKVVRFEAVEIPVLQLHIEIEDAISLENVGDRIFVNFDNLNSDDEVSLHLPQYYAWRTSGPHLRSEITGEKTAEVDIYFMLPYAGYEPSTAAQSLEWDGKNIFVMLSSQGSRGTHDPPLVRLTREQGNWSVIRYTSPEFCQFRHNLDSYLKHVSGQTLRDIIRRETGLTISEFRKSPSSREFDWFVRHYIEGPFGFPSEVDYRDPRRYVPPE